jgi:hypothetical protein
MNRQLFARKGPRSLFTSPGSFYWSTLTVGNPGYLKVLKQLTGVPRFCKQP